MHNDNSTPPTPPNTLPYYTPYLGLRARLSQIWMNRWTVLLFLILVRVLLAIKDVDSDIARAKTEALSACSSVESVGSAMASMPHYLSGGVNAVAADTMTSAVHALMKMLDLAVTGVEEIILFLINMYTSTYVCLITLAVSGSLHVAIDMIEKVGKFMNESISGITGEIATDVTTFTDSLNKFLQTLGIPVAGLLGGSKTVPTIDLSSGLAKLTNIQIPIDNLDADLTKLNNSIPTFADVQNFTRQVVSIPFDEVRKLINGSIGAYTFDKSVFPVPQKKALSFCSNNPKINDFFTGLVKVVLTARKVFIIVIILLAIAACVPMAYREIWRWRTMQQRAQLVQKNAFDPLDVIYIASRPTTTTVGIKAAAKFKSTKRQILTRWFVAYCTTLPALFVLALGLAGLAGCLCQYIVLQTVEKQVPAISAVVGDFAEDVVFALNNASVDWARGANGVVTSTNTKINQDVFGWVNTSTTAVNKTLNVFTDEMNKALNTTFGGTILYDPIKGVMNCLVELKVVGIQKGLTWVHDNAHVNFPPFREDVFSLGAAASLTNSTKDDSFLASPGDTASDHITGAVVKVAEKLKKSLQQEMIISLCIIGLYFLNMLFGLGRCIYACFKREKTRAEGGPVYTGENRGPPSPRSPIRSNNATFPEFGEPVSSIHQEKSAEDMHQVMWGHSSGGLTGRGLENEERMGSVGEVRNVQYKPGHERVSSYGYLDEKR
ncbi:putative plasma membrane fusion protein prm1 [Tricladium varicosporioides]|nr:putative plasma membrane fusion protein prm1 [Hymenoscyphus varicosporioides]